MQGKTRSGATFGAWDGEAIAVVDDDFDLGELIKRGIEEEREEQSDEDNDYEVIEGSDDEERLLVDQSYCPTPAHPTIPCQAPPANPPIARDEMTAETADPPALDPSASRKARINRRKHENRKRKRLGNKKDAADDSDVEVRASTRRKHIDPAMPIETDLHMRGLRVTKTGYTAMRDAPDAPTQHRVYRLKDMVGPDSKFKFDLYRWQGRKTVPFVDKRQKVFALLAGQPDSSDPRDAEEWMRLMHDFAHTIEETGPQLSLASHQKCHRRGTFPASAHGHSYGGGQTEPMNIAEKPANKPLFQRVLKHPGMERIAGYVNGVARGWAPDLHAFQRQYRRRLLSHHPNLQTNFRSSVWSSITVNYGPRTVTFPHRDFSNIPWGWCPITALGNYDYRRGGHLILWELRLVVEFPPGSTIIIPSSILTHSNVAIAANETRYSVTQYTAGGLIRWVDQGYQTKEAFLASLSPQQRAEEELKAKRRYRTGLDMYATLESLRTRNSDSESDLTELDESDDGGDADGDSDLTPLSDDEL
ncbi:hypothetical protein FB107DRAFT_221538 [Schizophyllum commune]